MNKKISILTLLCILLIAAICADASPTAEAELKNDSEKLLSYEATVSFPDSLQIINPEAFAETAFTAAPFNDHLTHIGDQAFRDAVYLSDVYIPKDTVFIGTDVFPQMTVIHVAEDSYAEFWAKRNGYQFVVEVLNSDKVVNPEYHFELILFLIFFIPVGDEKSMNICRRFRERVKSMRPQDRPELYPIDYRFP